VQPPADPPTPASSPRIPSRIGHYRIVGLLGEGGMGTVYEAEQDHPQRRVALKVIRGEYTSPELLQRFTREAEVLGRLQHAGIAQIYEANTFDEHGGARPFFAMELARGEPLTEYADRQALGSAERLALFALVCDAVHYAHGQGVIHRDLKPANILVTATGQPKILDFGVALLFDGDVQVTRQTSAGEVIGTLQYMSPEQVNADPVQIDVRSDVYSLGVILYELLSRRLPYDLSSKMILEAARAILVDDPEPLSAADRTLGGDIEIIVGKALEKERQRRYDSANDLASDVRRFLGDEPIAARRASAVYQLRKFTRRNRALVGGLAFGAAVLVVGTAVSSWQAIRATAAERLAESRRIEATAAGTLAEERRELADIASRRADSARLVADASREHALRQEAAARASAMHATEEAAKATAANTFLRDMLGASSPGTARGRELTVREVLDSAAARIDSGSLAGQPEVRAGVQSTIGRTYYALGLFPQARPHLDSAYTIRRRVLGANNTETATSARDLGELYRASGRFAAADTVLTSRSWSRNGCFRRTTIRSPARCRSSPG
jgi:predicted Ser/Thr protein kinase